MKALSALALVAVTALVLLPGCGRQQPPADQGAVVQPAPPPQPPAAPAAEQPKAKPAGAQKKPYPNIAGTVVKLETDKGTIVLELYDKDLPRTVANFKQLVKDGYYDGKTFYRVEDWVIQAGENPHDLRPGLEFETSPKHTHDRGALGLARTDDPNSGKTEFYIVKRDAHELDDEGMQQRTGGMQRGYCCFGRTLEGLDVVDSVQMGDKIKRATIVQEAD